MGGSGSHVPFPTSQGSGGGAGGSGTGGGGSGGNAPPDCNIVFPATLVSPDATMLSKVKAGDVLGLGILVALLRGMEVKSLGAVLDGKRVGDIDDRRADQVVACMEAGVAFAARVQTVSGLQCLVRVAPA